MIMVKDFTGENVRGGGGVPYYQGVGEKFPGVNDAASVLRFGSASPEYHNF
jgi:hypothetical protein